jgi:hypothetical protein
VHAGGPGDAQGIDEVKRTAILLAIDLALGACGGDDAVTDDAAPDAQEVDAPLGTVEPRIGTFVASLVETGEYTSLVGKVYNGVQPEAVQWDTSVTDGDCMLMLPRVPFCSTPCGSGAVCVGMDMCEPYAMAQDLGTITATGFVLASGDASFTMSPIQAGYQPPAAAMLTYPGWTAGEKLELVTSGSAFTPAFTVGTRGVAALALTTPTPIALANDTALDLAWTAAENSTIDIKLDISHHGGTKGKIECETDDDGSLTIGAALIGSLLDLGAAGYPTIIITRSHTGGAAVTGGRVDFTSQATLERAVTVPGITSCTEDTECISPQTCQPDLTCG